jgi:hypothetical protein
MKSFTKIFLPVMMAVFVLGLSNGMAQAKKEFTAKDLPEAVSAAFKKAYPNAEIKGAGKEIEEGKTFYEVESLDGKIKRDLTYTTDGTLSEIEETIAADALPKEVINTLHAAYPKAEIKKAETVTRGAVTNFEIVIKSEKKSYELVFDKDGKITKTEEKKAKKEKKENEKEEKD